jgi:putative phage-type endonuclease
MTMTIRSILERYYSDYLKTSFITKQELEELLELFAIIMPGNEQDLTDYFKDKEIIDLSTETETTDNGMLELLRSRELKGDQRSALWLQERMKYITASVSGACAGLTGKVSRENLMLEKASLGQFRSFMGGYYTDMGNIFEPVTNSYYCALNNKRIHDFGLIANKKEPYTFLAASTDGVTSDLINIEIKTLVGRFPNGKVKKEYYHQMQHQMECLDLERSDFVEVRYDQYADLKDLRRVGKDNCGLIAEIYDMETKRYEYEYSSTINPNIDRLAAWQETRSNIISGYATSILVRWIPWVQNVYSCIRVDRDPKWIANIGPLLLKFYQELQVLKADQPRVQKIIMERSQRIHKRRTEGQELFSDCLL